MAKLTAIEQACTHTHKDIICLASIRLCIWMLVCWVCTNMFVCVHVTVQLIKSSQSSYKELRLKWTNATISNVLPTDLDTWCDTGKFVL